MLLLETKNLTKHFGGLKALEEIYLRVERERIVSIIGPNGAGKTTLFNCVTGMYRPTKGASFFTTGMLLQCDLMRSQHSALHGRFKILDYLRG